jgi:exodeoxyribonuclease V alpha subunit
VTVAARDDQVDGDCGELDELVHAYAVAVHRSGGSASPCVVVRLTTGAWMMLQRNLPYTAVARARKLVVLVGSTRALSQAVRATGSGRRHTGLAHRLRRPAPRKSSPARSSEELPPPRNSDDLRST